VASINRCYSDLSEGIDKKPTTSITAVVKQTAPKLNEEERTPTKSPPCKLCTQAKPSTKPNLDFDQQR
jgi:hypothetical protein